MCRACSEDRQYEPQMKCEDCRRSLCPFDNRHIVLVDGKWLMVCDTCLPEYDEHQECGAACGPLADYEATFGGMR